MNRRPAALIAGVALTGLGLCLLGGCGGDDPASDASTTTSTTSVDKDLQAMLPSGIRSAGVVKVGIEAAFPPMEFKDPETGEITGFDVEYANAIAGKLGLKVDYQDQPFDQLVNSLATHRVDAVISAISDTAERRKRFDFIDYFESGAQAYTSQANASKYSSLTALCGQPVAFNAGTDYIDYFEGWAEDNCGSDDDIDVLTFGNNGEVQLQVVQGRAAAGVMGPDELAWVNKQQPGKFVPVGDVLNPAPYGIAVNKGDSELRDAIFAAAKELAADGTYQDLLDKWGTGQGAIDQPSLNDDAS
jgi:polar amino acid transport system substrate-binding protein